MEFLLPIITQNQQKRKLTPQHEIIKILLANENDSGCLFSIKRPTIKHLDVHSILHTVTDNKNNDRQNWTIVQTLET